MSRSIALSLLKEYGNLELLAKQMVEGFITGLHKSPYHGFSVEFAEHRLYNNGESTRHLDWKIFAKTDKLFTKRYEEETNLRAMLLLDTSSSMFYPESNHGKMAFSTLAAACLAYLLSKQRDAVGLMGFSDKIDWQTEIKSTQTHLRQILAKLEEVLQSKPKNSATSISEVLHLAAESIHKRSLVIIFSDMLDNPEHEDQIFGALQHLKHKKHEVLLFHVSDGKTEMQFEFEDRPYEFIDLETGEKMKLKPHELQQSYKAAMLNYKQKLKLRCASLKIDFIEADINLGIEQILTPYLVKRGKMR